MSFLDVPAEQIRAQIAAVATRAAGFPVVVRVGAERSDHRNFGLDLPRAKSKHEGRLVTLRVRAALEAIHVVLAPHALAPRVGGSIEGQVQVHAFVDCGGRCDAAHLNVPYSGK